nr:hypothetical protein [Actinomadura madurae]
MILWWVWLSLLDAVWVGAGFLHGGVLEEGLGAGEVPVHGLPGDAEVPGDVGDAKGAVALIDMSSGGSQNALDGFLVADGGVADLSVGAH